MLNMTFALTLLAFQGTQATPRDLFAGFRQNYEAFPTLHVCWTQTTVTAENRTSYYTKIAQDLERQADTPGLTPEKKAELLRASNNTPGTGGFSADLEPRPGVVFYALKQAQNYQSIATRPENRISTFFQDYRTDRKRFQMRTQYVPTGGKSELSGTKTVEELRKAAEIGEVPAKGEAAKVVSSKGKPPKVFTTSAVPITPEALSGTFSDIPILSYATDSGFRLWSGQKRGDRPMATVLASNPNTELFTFPPLGVSDPLWGSKWNPIDSFFALPESEMTVEGTKQVANRNTIVLVYRKKVTNVGSFLPLEFQKEYKDKITRFEIIRAFVDPEQGCLPLRMEWDGETLLEGKPLVVPGGTKPYQVLEDVKVERIKGGSYYPVSGALRLYALDSSYTGKISTIGDLVKGTYQPIPTALDQTTSWKVARVMSGEPFDPREFAMTFPTGTAYYDQTRSQGLFVGQSKELLDGPQSVGERPRFPEQGSRGWLGNGFVLVNVVLVVLVVLVIAYRRVARRAGRGQP